MYGKRVVKPEHHSPDTDQWQALANAIILQAARDYRQDRKVLQRIRKRVQNGIPVEEDERKRLRAQYDKTAADMRQLEHFFTSGWFTVLSDADGHVLLQQLRKEAA